jgi:hypothetical protein
MIGVLQGKIRYLTRMFKKRYQSFEGPARPALGVVSEQEP